MTRGKNASSAKATAQLITALSSWDGKKHTWPDFRKEVMKWATANGVAWILNAGRALFNRMQTLQEDLKKRKKIFKLFFEDHSDDIWAEALESRENGCVEAQLDVVKVDTLKARFGSNFTEHTKCGFTCEDKHKGTVNNALEQKLLQMNILVLATLTESITEVKDTSTQKEVLRRMLFTAEIRNIMDGGPPKDIDEWFDKPQLMPAINVWFQILWKYEGLSENVDSQFISDFNEIADSEESITEVNSRLQLLMEPAAKVFTSVQDFCDHLRVCALVKRIKTAAKGTSKHAIAWKLADDAIVAASRTNTVLTMTNVNNAISLAQRHLNRDDDDDDDVQTLTTKTSEEFEQLKAQLAEAQESIKTLNAQVSNSDRGKAAGGGGGGQNGAGNHTGQKRQKTVGFKGNPWKTCTICKKKHAGDPPESKCFQRDLQGEKEALEKLIKQKAEAGWQDKSKKD